MEDLDERVAGILAHSPRFEADFNVAVSSDRLTIFDSAHPGFDVFPPSLPVSLEPGRYAVATCDEAVIKGTEITLHRLERLA